jgi:hypothetical protein
MHNGQVVVSDVSGTIIRDDPAIGLGAWAGSFSLPSGTHLDLRTMYQLVLDDGGQGEFMIKNVQVTSSGADVRFRGSGAPP